VARRCPAHGLAEVLHDPARPGLHRAQPQGLEARRVGEAAALLFRPPEGLEKQTTPWTPGISLIIQQKHALDLIKAQGLENLLEHHRILGDTTRAGVKALGLELLAKNPGNILTAVKTPAGLDGAKLVKIMQNKYMAYIAGAQDPNKGKFFRIAHLGYMGGFDVLTALAALEMTLADLGYPCEFGASAKAAQTVLKENWQ
jgi:aspartate aminotransferase-like enzyme